MTRIMRNEHPPLGEPIIIRDMQEVLDDKAPPSSTTKKTTKERFSKLFQKKDRRPTNSSLESIGEQSRPSDNTLVYNHDATQRWSQSHGSSAENTYLSSHSQLDHHPTQPTLGLPDNPHTDSLIMSSRCTVAARVGRGRRSKLTESERNRHGCIRPGSQCFSNTATLQTTQYSSFHVNEKGP